MRPKVVVAAPWPLLPGRDGRRAKALARYLRWATQVDLDIVSLGETQGGDAQTRIGAGIVERRVPAASDIAAKMLHVASVEADTGVFFALAAAQTPRYGAALAAAGADALFAVASTPFTFHELKCATCLPVLLDAQSVESNAANDNVPDDRYGREVRRAVWLVEREAVADSAYIVASSADDRNAFVDLGRPRHSIGISSPIRLALDSCPTRAERESHKSRSNFAGRTVAIFAGSRTYGNATAVHQIRAAASELPQVFFVIIGGIVDAFRDVPRLPNVGFTGILNDADFAAALLLGDVCLEPGHPAGLLSSKLVAYVQSGAPLVAMRATASAAGLEHGDYVDLDDRTLAQGISAVLADPAGADARAAQAFARLRAFAQRADADDEFFRFVAAHGRGARV